MEGDVDATVLNAQTAIARSMEYARLKAELAEREAEFASISTIDSKGRLKSSLRLEAKKRETKTFARDVARLARLLKNRPIESERLGRSESAFDAGDFALVSTVMDADELRAEQQ